MRALHGDARASPSFPESPWTRTIRSRLGGRLAVLLVEAVDATGGVHQLLLAREERVGSRADVDAEVAARGERVVDGATRTGDVGGLVVRMSNRVLHNLFLLPVTARWAGLGGGHV